MTIPRRDSKVYRRAKATFRAECESVQAPCWMDGLPIDYAVTGGPDEPNGFSVDHAIPWTVRPDLAYDPGNFRPAHWQCNSERGTGDPTLGMGEGSRIW